jgi:hypothetical protein
MPLPALKQKKKVLVLFQLRQSYYNSLQRLSGGSLKPDETVETGFIPFKSVNSQGRQTQMMKFLSLK